MVTAAEAEAILSERKVIGSNLHWIKDGPNYRLDATVLALESQQILRLRGFSGRTNRSLALLYNNQPIRKYTVHSHHLDPVTREVVREPHKHIWDDEWEDKRVYIPDDIRKGDLNEEVVDFLEECNIELRGVYRPGPFTQLPLV